MLIPEGLRGECCVVAATCPCAAADGARDRSANFKRDRVNFAILCA